MALVCFVRLTLPARGVSDTREVQQELLELQFTLDGISYLLVSVVPFV